MLAWPKPVTRLAEEESSLVPTRFIPPTAAAIRATDLLCPQSKQCIAIVLAKALNTSSVAEVLAHTCATTLVQVHEERAARRLQVGMQRYVSGRFEHTNRGGRAGEHEQQRFAKEGI